MNCRDIQEIAPLWLSGELEHAQIAEVLTHLENCAECARSLAEDTSLDARIRKAMGEEQPDSTRIVGIVRQRMDSQRRPRWLLAGGVAAAVLVAIGFGMPHFVPQQPGKLFVDAARDHRLEVMEHQPRRWRSDPDEIGTMAGRFGFTSATPAALAPVGFRLVHAKTCGLEGRPALHLVYTDGAREISIYVRRETDALRRDALQQAGSAEIGSERIASAERAGYSALVVTTGRLDECRQFAERAVSML
jgi:anti-sigma factor RsiW